MINNFVLTKDGSNTLYNKKYQEYYHSISGAYTEALEKYIKPLAIQNGDTILDFCFGLGYNSFVAISLFSNLDITALENDMEILQTISYFAFPSKLNETVNIFKNIAKNHLITDKKNNTINLIIGDALKTVKTLPQNHFDKIFFDPFSPKKAPEMWTQELFSDLFNILKRKGMLATYSCAKTVRKNMQLSGFRVIDGPSVGRKSPSTIAIKD